MVMSLLVRRINRPIIKVVIIVQSSSVQQDSTVQLEIVNLVEVKIEPLQTLHGSQLGPEIPDALVIEAAVFHLEDGELLQGYEHGLEDIELVGELCAGDVQVAEPGQGRQEGNINLSQLTGANIEVFKIC